MNWKSLFKQKKTTKIETPEATFEEDYYNYIIEHLPNEFVQYVLPNPENLRNYVHGLYIGKQLSSNVSSGIITDIYNSIEDIDDAKYASIVEAYNMAKSGWFSIYSDHYDSEYCSTLYNGIMPSGEIINIVKMTPEEILKSKKEITDYLSKKDPVPKPLTSSYLELRLHQNSNMFNVTCDKCGTPHGFKYDVPHSNLKCTLCNHDLVIYTDTL